MNIRTLTWTAATLLGSVLSGIWVMPLLGQNRVVIRGGTVLNVHDGSFTPDTTVVLQGDLIVSVSKDTVSPQAGDQVLDAAGKFILPGLIDLHVHYKDWAPELYVNHGVTTVVSLGDMHEWIKSQKDGSNSGLIPGPRVYISTNNLDGIPEDAGSYFARPHVHALKDPEDAIKALRQYASGGADAIKVYDGLSMEVLKALSREAKRAGIPLLGHFKDARIAAEVQANGIEHLNGIASTILDKSARDETLKKVRKGFNPPPESFMDTKRIPEVVDLMIKNNVYMNPTLRMSWQGDRALREKGFHYEDFDLTFNNWQLRYIPVQWKLANLKEYQEISMWHWSDLTTFEQEVFHRGYENSLKLVKAFSDAGGKLYAGTDCANMCVPGLGMHQELELIAESGVSPLRVLQAATVNPAELMRLSDKLGSVEQGKFGDILILDANPLENIRNTRKVWKVISRGQVLDGKYHASFRNPSPFNGVEQSSHFFPSPRIRWASPEALIESATSVTAIIHGTGFIPYSTVLWNGHPVKTEFVDQFQLKAELRPEILRIGTHSVTVANPDFGWGSIFASGADDLSHLGLRGYISNQFLVLVKPSGGSPIFPHPREVSRD